MGYLVMGLLGSWRRLFQMLVVPGEDAVQTVQQMFFFVAAVRLARIDNKLGFDAVAFEAAVEFLALARRINGIGVPLKNQGRSLYILEMHEGRTIQESGDLFWFVGEAVEPLVVGRTLLGAVFGDEIGKAGARDGGLESRGFPDPPFPLLSAVHPPANGRLLGIGDAPFEEFFYTRH